jgi:hypothetical protein
MGAARRAPWPPVAWARTTCSGSTVGARSAPALAVASSIACVGAPAGGAGAGRPEGERTLNAPTAKMVAPTAASAAQVRLDPRAVRRSLAAAMMLPVAPGATATSPASSAPSVCGAGPKAPSDCSSAAQSPGEYVTPLAVRYSRSALENAAPSCPSEACGAGARKRYAGPRARARRAGALRRASRDAHTRRRSSRAREDARLLRGRDATRPRRRLLGPGAFRGDAAAPPHRSPRPPAS